MKSITKYFLASSIIAILTITLFGFYSIERFHDNEIKNEGYKLEMCIRTFWELLSSKGEDFRAVDGKLLVDDYVVNGNFELPDRIQEIFGGVATIFMGDERVSTNVLDAEGKRALGTKLTGVAYDSVFKQERPYRGAATILDIPYLTAYDPITDNNGKIIGALFVGVKEIDFLARIHELKVHLTLTLVCMVMVFAIFMVLLWRAMKRVEDAKENQVRFQQTLLDTIPSPVFYKDAECRYLGCNRAFEAYVGFSQEELIGKKPHEIWPKELADGYRQQDLALLENPGFQVYETNIRYADGSLRDVIFNKATFAAGDGKVAGLVGVILDITERKLAEEATQIANQQLLDIVDFLPDATFVVDKEKRVIAWNRAIERMTGVKKQEIMGKGDYAYAMPFYNDSRPLLIDLLGKEHEQERALRNYTQIKQEGNTLFTEVFLPSFRNGGSRYLLATATPLFDKDGNQVGGIESIQDITEYKRSEEEQLRLKSQLNQAHIMETLMARLGHDLRTPLTPLFIMLSLLKKRINDPGLIKMVDMCLKNATSINNLADKTRIFATLSSSIKPYELENVSLATSVDQAVADCVELMSKKQIECLNRIDSAVLVLVVPAQLNILFVNLISNAVHYSAEQGVITISAERVDEGVMVSVKDDGVGLAPSDLEHIFDEFFKADESRHDIDAPGLGLSICKRIVQNHQGRIWAESPGVGLGTTIKFTLNDITA